MANIVEELRVMMPSKAKERLTQWLFDKISSVPINYMGEPTYRYGNALDDLSVPGQFVWEQDKWIHSHLHDCFEAAMKEYEKKYPLTRDYIDGMFVARRPGIETIK